MDKYILRMVNVFQDSIKETAAMISVTGGGGGSSASNSGFVRLTLTDADKRNRTQSQIAEQVTEYQIK